MLTPTPRDIERFWLYVNKTEGCWEWQSTIGTGGYGMFWLQGRSRIAHKVSYIIEHSIAYDSIPSGIFVCHSCDNRRCVRPDHLWLGTTDDNMADMVAKGRSLKGARNASHIAGGAYQRGELNGRAKLTPEQVIEIRRRSTTHYHGLWTQLAREYDVTPVAIRNIVKGKLWRHLAEVAA